MEQNLFIETENNEINELTILKIKFNTDVLLQSGYQEDLKQVDAFLKKPVTNFNLYFNTYDEYNTSIDGFPLDLGLTGTTVDCQEISNLFVRENEILTCELFTESAPDYYKPIKVVISNFERIEKFTENIEFHILDITWTQNANNLGWVEFEIV